MTRNNLVYIVLDSCRYDSYCRAKRPNMDRIARAELRYSYASWTSPSHFTLLMGQVPHESPRRVFASEIYKKQFVQWVDRLGVADLSFKSFIPQLSLPKVMKDLGYNTIARVSMPVLNSFAGFNRSFDDYKLMANHNDFAGMVREMEFPSGQSRFYFLNLGETHYPYMLDDKSLPRISGLHGVLNGMDALLTRSADQPAEQTDFFSLDVMRQFHEQQVRCVEYVDALIGEMFQKSPPNTYFIITADHGELFGEDNYFGHGPVMHLKCFEVPFLEGLRPAL
jgi:arylsulfatase A-like enzyme